KFCLVRGIPETCGPGVYSPLRSVVYRNQKGKRFLDVTSRWNVRTTGNTLGIACADFQETGRPVIAIANDAVAGDLFVPDRASYRNMGKTSGTAFSREGRAHAGMGVDWGDYDNDGRLD